MRHTVLETVLTVLFKTGFVVFLLAGTLYVALQVLGVVVGSAGLTVDTLPHLPTVMTTAAGATGLLAFVMSYVLDWDTSGED